MAEFAVNVSKIFIKEHPNADSLELGNIGSPDGFQVVVGKGLHKTGALVAYIGENSVVPEEILKEYGYWNAEKNVGMLGGKRGNLVKAIKLRGEFSLGIVIPMIASETSNAVARFRFGVDSYPVESLYYQEGENVSHILGVTKYEPEIPTCMAGEVFNAVGMTLKYDIENFKKYPHVLQEGEEVFYSEKLHGTWTCLGHHPDSPEGGYVISSKGISGSGLAFKMNAVNEKNLYVRALRASELEGDDGIKRDVVQRAKECLFGDVPFYLLGETFGKGVQDLTYGVDTPQFRLFDCYVGEPGRGKYLDLIELKQVCDELHVELVPILYVGPFSVDSMKEFTDGVDNITGTHIREGIVVKPTIERRDDELGRVYLKSVSEAYLLRKGTTTEFG